MPLSEAMADTLADYCEEYPEREAPLFVNSWRRPINVHWIRRLVVRLGRGAGIEHHVCPRMLRHTFGTYMAERNGKPVTRALLGHGTNASTDVYMHLAPRAYRKSINRHAYGRAFNRGQYL
jgi:integrase